jgi:hypothetical protein
MVRSAGAGAWGLGAAPGAGPPAARSGALSAPRPPRAPRRRPFPPDVTGLHWMKIGGRGCQLGVTRKEGATINFVGFRDKVGVGGFGRRGGWFGGSGLAASRRGCCRGVGAAGTGWGGGAAPSRQSRPPLNTAARPPSHPPPTPPKDYDSLSEFFQASYGSPLQQQALSVSGGNWGAVGLRGSSLQMSRDGKVWALRAQCLGVAELGATRLQQRSPAQAALRAPRRPSRPACSLPPQILGTAR